MLIPLIRASALSLALFGLVFTGAPPAAAAPKGHLKSGFGAVAKVLDPQIPGMPGISVTRHMFDPLVKRGRKGEILPALATKWERIGPTKWKFHLRRGVKFHNGERFDARSVKLTLMRYKSKKIRSWQKRLMRPVKSVDIVDDYTVIVNTKQPVRTLPALISVADMLPPKATNFGKFRLHPIGTGPYKLVKFKPRDRVEMVWNPEYWGKKATFERITIRIIKNDSTRVAAFLAGEVDHIDNFPPDQIYRVKGNPDLKVISYPTTRVIPIDLNQWKQPAFRKKKVRQALNYAIDRQAIIKHVLGGYGAPATAPVPPTVRFHHTGLKPYTYNPKKAKRLLAEAGYPNGIPGTLTLGSPIGRYLKDREIAEAIAGQLAKVGLNVKLLALEWPSYVAERKKRKKSRFDFFLAGFGNRSGEAGYQMRRSFLSPNMMGYENKKLNKLLKKALATFDDKEAKKIYDEAQEIVWEEAPWIFVYYQPAFHGVNVKKLKDFVPRQDEYVLFLDAHF